MSTATVAIGSEFGTSFNNLPRTIQSKVADFMIKFMKNPASPGINYEKYKVAIDARMHSVRIDQEYRGIVFRQKSTGVYIFLWVGHHDEAYSWAKCRRCDVNPETHSVQLYEVQEVNGTLDDSKEAIRLFDNVRDRELVKLGLPKEQLRMIRWISDEIDLLSLEKALPIDAYENLQYLAHGIPYDEVLEMYVSSKEPDSDGDNTFAEALGHVGSKRSFVVIENDDELRRMMVEPLDKWRVFLHPTQRQAVEQNYSGSARVLGGAGTGKTVVAMHRAKRLAAEQTSGKKVLFTTYTTNLASDIKNNLKKICTSSELQAIEVTNLDAWVSQYLKSHGHSFDLIFDERVGEIWEEAMVLSRESLPYSARFFSDEWSKVVCAYDAFSLEEYVRISRTGRGTRLDRKDRIKIWKVFEAYQRILGQRHQYDIETAMRKCRDILRNDIHQIKYFSIIVDEGQDFSMSAYRLIRDIAGDEHRNDIFIVGDSHQRIYGNKAVLSHCGIHIRGRSSYLRINYRTTDEIQKYAFSMLRGISFDDLDGGIDDGSSTQSLIHGSFPDVRRFKTFGDEAAYILSAIRELEAQGMPLDNICIVARTNRLVGNYINHIREAGIPYHQIKRETADNRIFPGVRFATMHRVKGLEFGVVFVAAANREIIPLGAAIDNTDELSKEESLEAEKCLLYVALTRAKERVYITCHGQPSVFV
jgi:mRNA-degrading endonuclease RelE of RelBE toxin-antitoxin system